MKTNYIMIARNPNINRSNTEGVERTYEEQPVTVQRVVPNEIFNKGLFGIFLILILIKTKSKSLYSPTINPYETSSVNLPIPILDTAQTTNFFNVASIYPLIFLGLFGISLYLTLFIVLSPLATLYGTITKTKVFITTIKKRFFFIFTQINTTIYSLLNPEVKSGENLKRVQDLLSTKEELVKYFTIAAAIQKLAKENNVYLTENNNGSFKVFRNKSVVVDMWKTNYVRDLVIDQIASRGVNKSTSQSSFFPGANAFNISLFTQIKERLLTKLNEEILSNSTSPHYPLKLLNNTVVFLNKTTVKRVAAGSIVLLVKRPISSLTKNVITLSSQNVPFLLKKPNFLLRVKDSLGNLIPLPLRKLKNDVLHVFEPVSELVLVKQQFLTIFPKNSYLQYFVALFLKRVPDSYLELFFSMVFYVFIHKYLQHFLNLMAIRIVETFSAELDKAWNNTAARDLYEQNYKNSFQEDIIDND